jgi:uncharacterized membrane protein (UPF0136 family)
MSQSTILWVYIILLFVGGMIGFLKAGSKISLITSSIAGAVLILTALPGVFTFTFRRNLADIVMAVLLIVFTIRLAKTKKFMPSGMMLVVTLVALALRHLVA